MKYQVIVYNMQGTRLENSETYEILAADEREAKLKAKKRFAGEFDLDPAEVGIMDCTRVLGKGHIK